MTKSCRWPAGGALVALSVVIGFAATGCGQSSPHSRPAQSEVIDITEGDRPLRGTPIDLIGVGGSYVGLVDAGSEAWTVTSDDGLRWNARRPDGLPAAAAEPRAYPGGLNKVAHTLSTDGDAVYARAETGSEFDRLGSVSLYVSNAEAKTWTPVVLPVPAGKDAFPIAAATDGGRRYLAGAVYDPKYGRSYLDAAVWMSDDGSDWKLVDSPAFSGDGNQTIFSLDVSGSTVIAGGGDGALVSVDTCCFYPDGVALWRSLDRGDTWIRTPLGGPPYDEFDDGAVVGFVRADDTLQADAYANPARTVVSNDDGASWVVKTHPRADVGVVFPRASQILRVADHYIARTTPEEYCTDCTEGALARSNDGERWDEVSPRFPCGTNGRANYGFVSAPAAVGDSLAVLGACGEQLGAFDETLLAISTDNGTTWRIRRFTGPTGGPIPAVVGNERIVTLAGDLTGEASTQVRAIVVHA